MAFSASAALCAITTPLPAASPSAFSTTGKPKSRSASRACSAVSAVVYRAVGMAAWSITAFAKALLLSICAAARVGPIDGEPGSPQFIHNARYQRRFRAHQRQIRANLFGNCQIPGVGEGGCRAAMPGLPGAAKICTSGSCASFQQSACSRPPEPITRIFNAGLLSRVSHWAACAKLKAVVKTSKYDVIVVGAGHAGCEAARACARLGLRPR